MWVGSIALILQLHPRMFFCILYPAASTTQHCLPALSQSLDLGSSQRKRASERAFHLAYRGIVCMCVVSQAGRQAGSFTPSTPCSQLPWIHQRSNSVQPLASSRCRDRVKNCLFNATWLWEQDIIRQESIMAIHRYTCTATVRRHCSRLVNCGQVSEHKPPDCLLVGYKQSIHIPSIDAEASQQGTSHCLTV